MKTTHNLPARWPRTSRRCATALREGLDLPELKVAVKGETITISWVEGPFAHSVEHEVPTIPAFKRRRFSRLYRPESFGAAMLLPQYQHLHDCGWLLGQAAWWELRNRDFVADPLPDNLMIQGRVLAGMAGVTPGARIGKHRYRWDYHMWSKLDEVGQDVLAAVSF